MDDLAKSITVNSAPLKQRKQSEWLTKDRFWNFVFWFGMSSGLAIAHFLRTNLQMLDTAIFIYLSTLLFIPVLLILFNKTRFIQKDTFTNSEGIVIADKQMPYSISLAIITGVGFSILLSEFLPKNSNSLFVAFALATFVFSGFSLYFIFKNCPISILFNYKFWVWKSHQSAACPNIRVSSSNDRFRNYTSSSSRSSSSDYYTNPVYSSSPSNIYYESHRRR